MELKAVIAYIVFIQQNLKEVTHLKIISDSQYVIGLVSREKKFIANDFKTNAGDDIRNIDLVKELLKLLKEIQVEFVKIKAHQKETDVVNYNIEVDKLSRQLVREAVNS
jgi:ribonuclease HI